MNSNFTVYFSICLWFTAMTTDPGAVPRDAIPLPHDDEEHDYEPGDKLVSLWLPHTWFY